jgi:hypothetical protein
MSGRIRGGLGLGAGWIACRGPLAGFGCARFSRVAWRAILLGSVLGRGGCTRSIICLRCLAGSLWSLSKNQERLFC